jgi:hypothetical protein
MPKVPAGLSLDQSESGSMLCLRTQKRHCYSVTDDGIEPHLFLCHSAC